MPRSFPDAIYASDAEGACPLCCTVHVLEHRNRVSICAYVECTVSSHGFHYFLLTCEHIAFENLSNTFLTHFKTVYAVQHAGGLTGDLQGKSTTKNQHAYAITASACRTCLVVIQTSRLQYGRTYLQQQIPHRTDSLAVSVQQSAHKVLMLHAGKQAAV